MKRVLLENERFYLMGVLGAEFIHEINSPLTSLVLNLRELEKRVGETSEGEGVATILNAMKKSLKRVHTTSESFRKLLKEENLGKTSFQVSELVQESAAVVQPVVSGVARFEVDIQSDPQIRGVRSILFQALVNILANAAEAVLEKNRRVASPDSFIRIVVFTEQNWCVIEVEDSGAGMDSETLQRATEPFYGTKGYGLGLGLYLAKIAAEQHGGKLEITSKLGKGTRVRLVLPY